MAPFACHGRLTFMASSLRRSRLSTHNFAHLALGTGSARVARRCSTRRTFAGIYDRQEALAGIQFYAGDGASVARPILRKRGDAVIGHASIRMQLEWCHDEGVPTAVFTHCGTQIVSGDECILGEKVASLGRQLGVPAKIAFDGMKLVLRS